MFKIKFVFVGIVVLYLLLITSLQFANYSDALNKLPYLTNSSQVSTGINIFPWPYITIKDVRNDKVFFNSATCYFSFFSLITLQPKINYIKIDSLHIISSKDNLSLVSNANIIKEIFELSTILSQNIEIFSKELFLYSKNPEGHIDLIFSNLKIKNNVIKMICNDESIMITYKKNSNIDNIAYSIIHPDYSINKLEIYTDDKLSSGNVSLDIKKLLQFFKKSFIFRSSLESNNFADIPLDIKLNFTYKDNIFNIDQITINSHAISGQGSGTYSDESNNNSLLNFNLSNINLNKLFNLVDNNNFTFNIPPYLPNSNIIIESAQFLNEKATNIKLIIKNYILQEFSGAIDSGGNFFASGEFSANKYRALFEGRGVVNHQDLNKFLNNIDLKQFATESAGVKFLTSSDIRLTNIDWQLLNMLTQIDDIIFSSKYTKKQLAKTPYINASIDISNIDLEKNQYPFFSYINNFCKNLLPKNSESNYYSNLVNHLINNTAAGHLDITLNNSKIMNSFDVKDLSLALDLEPLNVNISSIKYTNNSSKASGYGFFSVSNIKPSLDLNLEYDYVNVLNSNVNDTFDSLIKIGQLYDFKQISFAINSKINKLIKQDISLTDIIFNISNYNDVINILKFTAKYENSNCEINGNVALYPLTLNLGYALNSFPSSFISNITNNMIPMNGGVFSVGGTLYGIGENFDQFIYNLLLNGNVIGKEITYNNIALDDFVKLINSQKYDSTQLQKDVDTYLSSGTTVFKELQGGLNFIKGVLSVNNLKFNTQLTSNGLSFNYNLYNYDINAHLVSSFYALNFISGQQLNDNEASELTSFALTTEGSLVNPKKSFDLNALIAVLSKRQN